MNLPIERFLAAAALGAVTSFFAGCATSETASTDSERPDYASSTAAPAPTKVKTEASRDGTEAEPARRGLFGFGRKRDAGDATTAAAAAESSGRETTTRATFGGRGAGGLTLEKRLPEQVVAGREFDYVYRVTNESRGELQNVVVTDTLSQGLSFTNTEPAISTSEGGNVSWNLGNLGPGESREIRARATVADATATISTCGTATFTPSVCAEARVVSPALALNLTAPADASVCGEIPIAIEVTNNGTAQLNGVTVSPTLPEGLTLQGRDRELTVARLAPGESKRYELMARATQAGNYPITARASETAFGTQADGQAQIAVKAPVLQLTAAAPNDAVIGRGATITYRLTNTGDAAAENTVLETNLPSGVRVARASGNGSAGSDAVRWNVGQLAPGASQDFEVELTSNRAQSAATTATARSECAQPASANASVGFRGVPGVLLEVVDAQDPIQVGNNEVYTITVTNQGTIALSDLAIACEADEGLEVLEATGETAGSPSGRAAQFQPLATLEPKASATYRVTVRGARAGDFRFRVTLTGSQLDRPVEESESTHVY